MEPTELGLEPRDTFEETVTLVRAMLGHEAPAAKKADLTEEDFSLMKLFA